MRSYYITFRSVTFAQRGESVLRKGGISCSLQRTPKWMEEQGCGYCLHIRSGEIASAVDQLRQNKIPFRKVYIRFPEGQVEELTL